MSQKTSSPKSHLTPRSTRSRYSRTCKKINRHSLPNRLPEPLPDLAKPGRHKVFRQPNPIHGHPEPRTSFRYRSRCLNRGLAAHGRILDRTQRRLRMPRKARTAKHPRSRSQTNQRLLLPENPRRCPTTRRSPPAGPIPRRRTIGKRGFSLPYRQAPMARHRFQHQQQRCPISSRCTAPQRAQHMPLPTRRLQPKRPLPMT